MKKIIALLMVMAMVLSLAACGAKEEAPATIAAAAAETEAAAAETEAVAEAAFTTIEEGKLIMSTNAAFPPYEMTTDEGGFAGIDVEIAGAIAQKLGIEGETRVNVGTLDHFAGMIGTGNIRKGGVTLSTGTVMALATMSSAEEGKSSGIAMHYGFVPNTYVMLPVAESGGVSLEWFRRSCMKCDYDEMNNTLAKREPSPAMVITIVIISFPSSHHKAVLILLRFYRVPNPGDGGAASVK